MKHELQYAQMRPATEDPQGPATIGERKTHILETSDDLDKATSLKMAKKEAVLFLAGRKLISLRPLHLPEKILQPKPEFIPVYDAN